MSSTEMPIHQTRILVSNWKLSLHYSHEKVFPCKRWPCPCRAQRTKRSSCGCRVLWISLLERLSSWRLHCGIWTALTRQPRLWTLSTATGPLPPREQVRRNKVYGGMDFNCSNIPVYEDPFLTLFCRMDWIRQWRDNLFVGLGCDGESSRVQVLGTDEWKQGHLWWAHTDCKQWG